MPRFTHKVSFFATQVVQEKTTRNRLSIPRTLQLKLRAEKSACKGHVTRGNFFLQLGTQIWVKKIFQAPVEL